METLFVLHYYYHDDDYKKVEASGGVVGIFRKKSDAIKTALEKRLILDYYELE
jgi:hypothetical protein